MKPERLVEAGLYFALTCAVLAVMVLLAMGCVSVPHATVPAGPESLPYVHHGINDGYHGPLPPDLVAHYAAMGGHLVIRTPHLSLDTYAAFEASVASAPNVKVLALIETPDTNLATSLASRGTMAAIENGNELELDPLQLSPDTYAAVQGGMASLEREAHFTGDIIMGGVYALTDGADGTKMAITKALARTGTILPRPLCGVHLYAPTQADVDWMNGVDCDWAVTETGSPTGCGTTKWQEQADYVAGVRALLAGVRRLKYFIVYQRPSGLTCSDLDTFGTENTVVGLPHWKPLDALLAQWVKP